MKILDHTDEHQPTLMRDIFANLIGEDVIVHVSGATHPFGGKLVSHNVYVIQLTSTNGMQNTYIPTAHIVAIDSDK